GYTQILKEDFYVKLGEEGGRVMQIVINNAKRMGQLIDDLLEFSRMGRKELSHVHVNMDELVQGIVQEFKATEPNRRINVIHFPLKQSKADSSMIRQVWINLVSNAFKYSRYRE